MGVGPHDNQIVSTGREAPRQPSKAVTGLAVVVCLVALSACRQDMHDQPKYTPYKATDFFPLGPRSSTVLTDIAEEGYA